MNLFSMIWFINDIKNGKSITHHNVETTGEEMNQRILNKFCKDEKSTLSDLVLKYSGYKNKLNKEI